MTASWTIKAGEKVYGPYTLERLRALADDGRFGPQSLVAPEGANEWRKASWEADFAGWFSAATWEASQAPTANTLASGAASGSDARANAKEKTQYVIVLDLKSGKKNTDIEAIIGGLGTAYQLFPMVWILASHHTPAGIRNHLLPELATRDVLFVVDAKHGKATWLNFAPEAAARIRSIWQTAS